MEPCSGFVVGCWTGAGLMFVLAVAFIAIKKEESDGKRT